jgi:hypothetical protein
VQGTRPNAVSAFRIFVEYILCAYTRINRITFTYYATCISRSLRAVPRVLGEPTLCCANDAPESSKELHSSNIFNTKTWHQCANLPKTNPLYKLSKDLEFIYLDIICKRMVQGE